MENQYDIIILGGGIAAMTAALYTSRAGLKTVILEKSICGGQVNTTHVIENFPSRPSVNGMELMELVHDQVEALGVEIRDVTEVDGLALEGPVKTVHTEDGPLTAPVVILATGRRPRALPLETECESIHYCAICDGSAYKGKKVLVVGGGNAGVEESAYLLGLGAEQVTIIEMMEELAASAQAQAELAPFGDRVSLHTGTTLTALAEEDGRLKGATLTTPTGETHIDIDGIFVYMGHETQSELFRDQVAVNSAGYIQAGEDMSTSIPGVFAAGDIIQKKYCQITTAMGDATIAALAAADYIRQLRAAATN